jgi:hypothetical protein
MTSRDPDRLEQALAVSEGVAAGRDMVAASLAIYLAHLQIAARELHVDFDEILMPWAEAAFADGIALFNRGAEGGEDHG